MNVLIRRALSASAVAGGLAVAGLALAGPASADATSGEHGLLPGKQSGIELTVPVHVGGNQVSVLGHGNTTGGHAPAPQEVAQPQGPGTGGSGHQPAVTVHVPVTVAGNQVVAGGDDNSVAQPDRAPQPAPQQAPQQTPQPERPRTSITDALLGGDQPLVDADVPLTACGNQVVVLGSGNATRCDVDSGSTSGAGSTGDQAGLDLLAPVAAIGNQVVLLGDDNTGGTGTTGSTGSTGSGDQADAGAVVPVVGGNQVVVGGSGNTGGTGTDQPVGVTPGADVPAPGQPGSGQPGTGTQPVDPTGTTDRSDVTSGSSSPSLQAGPASSGTTLPQTGAIAGAILMGALGLLLLLVGLALTLPAPWRRTPRQDLAVRAILRS